MISVTGTGRVRVRPDVVRVRLTATARWPAAAQAVAAAEATAADVRAALAAHGVTGADAASGGFALVTEQIWSEQLGPRTTGHRCDHEIAVLLRDVPAAGRVLGDVLAAGGDGVRVDAVEPGLLDATALRIQARELAWADALDAATRLAALTDRPLGAVRSVAEGDDPVDVPGVPSGKRLDVALSAGVPVGVQPGDVEVAVTLRVQWDLRAHRDPRDRP